MDYWSGRKMLSLKTIQELSTKWQTLPINVAREYAQHVFLSFLFQEKESEKLAFKGGTALRILYGSPRFSEDLDFSGGLKPFLLQKVLERTVARVKNEIGTISMAESKPTSGGYLAIAECGIYGDKVRLELNISLRSRVEPEAMLVTSSLTPPYQCLALPLKTMVQEKCEALLSRKKPRDYFDLYFILRQRLAVETVAMLKPRILPLLRSLDSKTLFRELKVFLPVSYHRVAANLPQSLENELTRL